MFDVSYNIQKVNEYLVLEKLMEDEMENKSNYERNHLWIDKYNQTTKGNIEELPKLLLLVHPYYYFNSSGKKIDEHLMPKHRRGGGFSQDIGLYDPCQIGKLIDVDCPFNEDSRSRGKCHADHHWPFVLGGANSLTNRILLCSYHNAVKTSGIYFFDWKKYPEWLDERLNQMFNLKS
jgi:hypothetical protein